LDAVTGAMKEKLALVLYRQSCTQLAKALHTVMQRHATESFNRNSADLHKMMSSTPSTPFGDRFSWKSKSIDISRIIPPCYALLRQFFKANVCPTFSCNVVSWPNSSLFDIKRQGLPSGKVKKALRKWQMELLSWNWIEFSTCL